MFILITFSKYIYVQISLKLLTSMKLTQTTVNIKSLFQRQILLKEHLLK